MRCAVASRHREAPSGAPLYAVTRCMFATSRDESAATLGMNNSASVIMAPSMTNRQLADSMRQLHDAVSDRLSEDEVERLFEPVYGALGYRATGVDIRYKRRGRSGVPDALLLNSDSSIQVVVELKNPREDLAVHEGQLQQYVRQLRAPYGLLSNGREVWLYERTGEVVRRASAFTLGQDTNVDAFGPFAKREINLGSFQDVQQLLMRSLEEGLPLVELGDLPSDEFLRAFRLDEPHGAFTKFVSATQRLLIELLETGAEDSFVAGAYDFWSKVYARDLSRSDAPQVWRPLLLGNRGRDVSHFMFSLETAYVVAARLILAKVIQDHDTGRHLTHEHLANRFMDHLRSQRNPRTDALSVTAYPEATRDLFNAYSTALFTSIYGQDLFDWWRDFGGAQHATQHAFSQALGALTLTVVRFDFSNLRGDLLGELYQGYFDADTRKALGEFYTPPEVVDFILDSVGYEGDGRLLDPATGSGTFLIHALRRYLDKNAGRSEADLLRGIAEEFRIVGFDVNPFAVMMAQINFAAHLVGPYARVASTDESFLMRRLPIVRTDSLRFEIVEGEERRAEGLQSGLRFTEEDITVQIELPIRTESGPLPVRVTVPRPETARNARAVQNDREWLVALQAMFAAVEVLSQAFDYTQPVPPIHDELVRSLSRSFSNPDGLANYLEPHAERLWGTLKSLKEDHGDGRFLKTLEDLMVGLVLKHYFKYNYVVGNPPYVRVQNLPAIQRDYWEGRYEWAQGKCDIYVPFIERAIDSSDPWLKPGGRLGYIIPNRVRIRDYATSLRSILPTRARVISITDFGAVTFAPEDGDEASRLFREAMVYPLILIAERTAPDIQYRFPVARLHPGPAPVSPAEAINAISQRLRDGMAVAERYPLATNGHEYGDLFLESSSSLVERGWFFMPEDERRVFDHLDAIGATADPQLNANGPRTRRLLNYTATESGGFYGFITGNDAVLVVQPTSESELAGESPTLRVRSSVEPEGFEVERSLLRPFLFGRDVHRWAVNWNRNYVIFPYCRNGVGQYQLLATREYANSYPQGTPVLEERAPCLLAYLRRHEDALRSRVDRSKYKRTGKSASQWYELVQPSYINLVDSPRMILQILAKRGSAVTDRRPYVFQAGGTGGGLYGVMPNDNSQLDFFTGLFNSSIVDFFLHQISSVHSGGYYSYADAYIKWLPIPCVNEQQEDAIAALAVSQHEAAERQARLRGLVAGFPSTVTQELALAGSAPETEDLSRLALLTNLARNLAYSRHRRDVDLEGDAVITIGNGRIKCPQPVAEILMRYWQHHGQVTREELASLRVPIDTTVQGIYLSRLHDWRREIAEIEVAMARATCELDDLVFAAYGLDEVSGAREIVTRFDGNF